MRYTLLEMVQRILESMESDEVSDINETPEATSVANIIKECYFDIVGDISPPETDGLFKLDASGDNTKPCLMTVPSTVASISWLKYDISDDLTKPKLQDLRWVSNEEFLFYQSMLDQTDASILSMVVEVNGEDFNFRFRDDRFPTYYTVFDESIVIFDAYDADTESTLTQARTVGFGPRVVAFTMDNSFVPDLDPRQFQLLLQESKATAFMELKQVQNPRAEMKARKNHILAQKNKGDNNPAWPNQEHASFGRRGVFNRMTRAMREGV